jgi:hypothetical protein
VPDEARNRTPLIGQQSAAPNLTGARVLVWAQRITVGGQAFSFTAFEDSACDVYARGGRGGTVLEDAGQVS